MTKLHVGLVSPVFPHPKAGVYPGIERHVSDLARHLRKYGNEVTIFTTFWNGGKSQDEFEGMPIYRARDLTQAVGRYAALLDLHYLTWGRGLLKFKQNLLECDVLHALGPLSTAGSMTANGLPLVTHFHHHEEIRRKIELLHKPFHRWLEATAYRNSTLVMTPSRNSCRDLATHFAISPERVRVVPHAVDTSTFAPKPKAQPGESMQILFVGGHEPRKGVRTLLEALALVRKEGISARLVTVGGGSQMEVLKNLARQLGISEAVEFRGYVPDDDGTLIPRTYAESNLFVLPSLQEGFGFTLLEAMASGVPIIATKVSAIPEVVEDTAMLVQPEDARALAEAIKSMIRDSDKRAELGTKARARAEKLFSWDRVIPQIMAVYEEAIGIMNREP